MNNDFKRAPLKDKLNPAQEDTTTQPEKVDDNKEESHIDD